MWFDGQLNVIISLLIYSYSKVENLNYTRKELRPFTHLLIEARNKHNRDIWPIVEEDFTSLEFVECFRSVGIQYGALMPIRVKTKPCIGILKRRLDKNNYNIKENRISNWPKNEWSILFGRRTCSKKSLAKSKRNKYDLPILKNRLDYTA